MPELLPCQGALKDTGCVCVCCPGTERSVCPRAFGAKGDEVPAGIVFEGVVAGGKIGVKFEKSGEWKWRARRDWGVLLSGFYFDFFYPASFPSQCCSGTASGSPLHLGKPRAHFLCWHVDELFHGMGMELGCS